jgi:hypothetical protein
MIKISKPYFVFKIIMAIIWICFSFIPFWFFGVVYYETDFNRFAFILLLISFYWAIHSIFDYVRIFYEYKPK